MGRDGSVFTTRAADRPTRAVGTQIPVGRPQHAAAATAVAAGDYSVIDPNDSRVDRPDIQAAASGGCQRDGLVEDCRGSAGDSGPFMLLLPWPGWLKTSAVPIVPAVATQPNCAGMPVTRADTNMPNHIIRDPATDCMK